MRDKIVKSEPIYNQDIDEKIKAYTELNENYAKKFGLLKKACVLYSYDRYNDAFTTVADAAVIAQKEKEQEKE